MPDNKKFWQFRNQADNTVELLLYGDISQSSWWGDEATPKQFADELAGLGALDKIVVRINSGGGDVFAAQAIGNLLEQHPAEVTARIDGLCASAATIVACHCGKVVAANDSTYMVHPVRMGAYGYYDAEELGQYIEALAAIKESIVGLYVKKTGRDKEELTGWMDATSWWTAAQAKEHGFVDELADEGETVVENRGGTLFVNSVSMHLPFDQAPAGWQEKCRKPGNPPKGAGATTGQSSRAGAPAGGFVNQNGHEKEVTDMANEIKTADELRAAFPALVGEIETAAAQNAVEQERQRIQDIEDMSLPGSEALTTEAKFTKPMSAADYAKAVVKNAKQQGAAYLAGAAKDAAGSGMAGVEDEGAGGEKPDEFLDALKAMGKQQK